MWFLSLSSCSYVLHLLLIKIHQMFQKPLSPSSDTATFYMASVLNWWFQKQKKRFQMKYHQPKVIQDLNVHGQKNKKNLKLNSWQKLLYKQQPVTKSTKLKIEAGPKFSQWGMSAVTYVCEQPQHGSAAGRETSDPGSCYLCGAPAWPGSFQEGTIPASKAISGWGIFSTGKVSHTQNTACVEDGTIQ